MAGIWAGHTVLANLPANVAIVQGSSMVPTFESGTSIVTVPSTGPLRRGDVVVAVDGMGGQAVKRVVGLPREVVQLRRGYVFVQGRMLHEPYLPKNTFTYPSQENNRSSFAIGSGCYFLLGDNRACSMDSRNVGPVTRDQIIAVVQLPAPVAPAFAPYALSADGTSTILPVEEAPMRASRVEMALPR